MYLSKTCMYDEFSTCSVSSGTFLHRQIRFRGYGTNAAQHDSKCFQKYHSLKFQTKENVL